MLYYKVNLDITVSYIDSYNIWLIVIYVILRVIVITCISYNYWL